MIRNCLTLAQTTNQTSPCSFSFQRRGKTKVVKWAFQAQWFGKWGWLHYDSSRDLVFCHTCITILKTGQLRLSTGHVKYSAYIFAGYSYWKNASVAFGSHKMSATHKRAVEGTITLPQTTRVVWGDAFISSYCRENKNWQCLITIIAEQRQWDGQGLPPRQSKKATPPYQQRCLTNYKLISWFDTVYVFVCVYIITGRLEE